MTIKPEIPGMKLHNIRAQYIGVSCLLSQKLICFVPPKKHYVVLGQLLRFYLDRRIRLVKVHRAICFDSFPYVAWYIANNTEKLKKFNYDNVKEAVYKLMNNALYGKMIEIAARRTNIILSNYIEMARKLAEKPHCSTSECTIAMWRRRRSKE